MDPYIHTIIAVGLMYTSFAVGKYLGKQEGYENIIQTLLHCFRADNLEINEDLEFYVTIDGETKKVN